MAGSSTGSDTPAKTAEKAVKYVGTADVREINAASWKSIGVEDQNKVVWDRSNNWSVSVSDLKDGAVKYLDESDDGFVVKEA